MPAFDPSDKQSSPSSRPRALSTAVLQGLALTLVSFSPWILGGASWASQLMIVAGGIALLLAGTIYSIFALVRRGERVTPTWLCWVLTGLGFFALLQSVPMFPVEKPVSTVPSVAMQQWALGFADAPVPIEPSIIKVSADERSLAVTESPWRSEAARDAKLSLSVEPLHTLGASASLFLAALMVWVGGMAFRSRRSHIYLFAGIAALGLIISMVGIQGSLTSKQGNFFTGTKGASFATFVSKNSAGAFLNVAIAAALGIVSWTMIHHRRRRSDMRYRFSDSSVLAKIRGVAEDFVGDLSTPQIVAVFLLVFLVSALLITLCRGAAVSALGSIVVTLAIVSANFKKRSGYATGIVVLGVTLTLLVGFQLDDQVYSRLESITELERPDASAQSRFYIWRVAVECIRYYGFLGSGLGTFHYSALPFQEPTGPAWYYHAESLIAQCGVELGTLGLVVLMGAVVLLIAHLLRIDATSDHATLLPIKLAGTFLVLSQLIHSAVDFGLIIPAVYLPASLMAGVILAVNRSGKSQSHASKTDRRVAAQMSQSSKPSSVLSGVAVLVFVGALSIGFIYSGQALRSLSASEAAATWLDKAETSEGNETNPRFSAEFASLIADKGVSLGDNPTLLFIAAEAIVHDVRASQLSSLTQSQSTEEAWKKTAPILLQVELKQSKDKDNHESIIEKHIGDEGSKVFSNAARLAFKARLRSPLDWRPAWKSVLYDLNSPANTQTAYVPVIQKLAGHRSAILLAASVYFDDVLPRSDVHRIWKEAMRCNSVAANDVAKLMANLRKDGEMPIEIFPRNQNTLRNIAGQPFTKKAFPLTNRSVWQALVEVTLESKTSQYEKAVQLADAARELEDVALEAENLAVVARYRPDDLAMQCRLANVLLVAGDKAGAQEAWLRARRIDAKHPSVQALSAQFLQPIDLPKK